MLAYLDCFSGVSGDMLLGALLGAGLDEGFLRRTLEDLGLPGWEMTVEQRREAGLQAVGVTIRSEDASSCRHLGDLEEILDRSSLISEVREGARRTFRLLAGAEARVHGCSLEEVHFHEVGAVDALLDVVGTVAGLQALGVERVVCSSLPLPTGWVHCQHGELPLPVPAVCELLQGVPVYGETLQQELVTPTGAALVRALAEDFGPLPPLRMERVGYGAGSMVRADGRPNLLRLILGREQRVAETQLVEVIETHLDDWNAETWPYIAERLLAEGALDASLTPMQMKKGRPGFLLRVVTDPAHALALKDLLFRETTCIGLRSRREERQTLPREQVLVETPWGAVAAKKIQTPDGALFTPEYEDCVRLAREKRIPVKTIYHAVARAGLPVSGDPVI